MAPSSEYVLLLQSNGYSVGVLNPPYRGNSAGVFIFNSVATHVVTHVVNLFWVQTETKNAYTDQSLQGLAIDIATHGLICIQNMFTTF